MDLNQFRSMTIEEDVLKHYGVLGMKWGIRRYQPYSTRGRLSGKSGKEIGEAKKSGKSFAQKLSDRKANKAAKKLEEERLAKKKAKKEAQRKKKEHEKNKEEALRSGSAKQLKPYVRELSDKQLQDALNRIQNEKRLSEISSQEKKRGEQRVDDVMQKIGKYTEYANKGINAWNTAAKIHNTFNEDQWRTIDGVYKTKKKK